MTTHLNQSAEQSGANALNDQLRKIVTDACQHPPGHPLRQRGLTRVIRLVTPKLWKESAAYYPDALQQTWIYFCKNICTSYDPNLGGVSTWLNAYLKRRLQDFYLQGQRQRQHEVSSWQDKDGETVNVADMIPDRDRSILDDKKPMWEKVQEWAETNEELQQIHIEGHPEVTARVLILRRLLSETKWKDLVEEFGVKLPTLNSFYQRQCMTRLRSFGEAEGLM
jgi:hypothetical protein